MPAPIPLTDFSAGELSPRLRGRTDAAIYMKGAEQIINYAPIPFGGVTRRPGSWRLADVTTDLSGGTEPLLVPFTSQEYDDVVLMVWQDSSDNISVKPIIFGSSGVTEGTTRQLASTHDGLVDKNTKWARAAGTDKIFFAAYKVRPFTITLAGPTIDDWGIAWTSWDIPEWDTNEYYIPGDIVKKGATYYSAKENTIDPEANVGKDPATATNYWGSYTPTDTEPSFKVDYDVLSNDDLYWPSCVTAHEGRIVYAGSGNQPTVIWGSGIRQYEHFVLGQNDSSPWRHTLSSDESGRIHWMVSSDILLCGTDNSEFYCQGNQFGITPTAIIVTTRTTHSSSQTQALLYNEMIFWMQADNQQMRAASFSDTIGRYYAQHINKAADHIFKENVESMALSRSPRTHLFCVLGDGSMVQVNYERDMQVIAFFPWGTKTTEEFLSVAVLPANGAEEDRVVVVVKRGTKYLAEVFHWTDFSYHNTAPQGSTNTWTYGMYLDSATEITVKEDATGFYADGLTAYEGEEVDICLGHAPHPSRTVTAGVVRLDYDADIGYVGYNYESIMKSMNMPPSLLVKRINQYGVRFIDSVGGLIGPTYEDMEEIIFREGEVFYDEALPLYSGDFIVDNVGGFDRDLHIWVSQNAPSPQTMLQIVAWTEVYSRSS